MATTLLLRRFSRSAFLRALALAAVLAAALLALMNSGVHPQPGPMERSSFRGGAGYWLLGKDGGVFAFGDAKYFGPNRNQGRDIAGMAATASGNGYWTVDDDGDVFAYGDAIDYGSRPGPEIDDIVGFAPRTQGDGYWMVAKDGAVYQFGAAGYFGGANTLRLTKPIVGMAATPSGKGYWLIAGDGGVFAYGDAGFFGSTGNIRLNRPIVDFGPSPDGKGYRFIGNDGGVFAYGDAGFFGSTGAVTLNQPIVGFAATATGKGYWLVGEDGGVFSFGDAAFFGSTGAFKLNAPIVAIVATPRIKVPPVAKDDSATVAEDGSATIDVQANDTHALPASVSIDTPPGHGTATVSAGNVVYAPTANYNGSDSFKYTLTDTVGHSATATVSMTVTPVNDAPVAAPGSRSATEETQLSNSVSATDVDNDALTFSKVADPAHGALTMNADGSFTYMPTANYAGADSFTFNASDGKANSNTATVNITVAGTQDVPTIADVTDQSTAEGTATGAISVTVGDVDGDTLTLSGSSSNDTLVPDANVVVGGSAANPTVTITPAPNQSGTSTITLTVSDGNGGTASDSFTLTVAVNDQPDPNDDNVTLAVALLGIDVLDNDLGLSDVPITVEIVAGSLPGTEGTAIVTLGNEIQLLTALDGDNDDLISFQYKVTDADGDFAFGTVTVNLL
jgi:VCBS repeat-containing protein